MTSSFPRNAMEPDAKRDRARCDVGRNWRRRRTLRRTESSSCWRTRTKSYLSRAWSKPCCRKINDNDDISKRTRRVDTRAKSSDASTLCENVYVRFIVGEHSLVVLRVHDDAPFHIIISYIGGEERSARIIASLDFSRGTKARLERKSEGRNAREGSGCFSDFPRVKRRAGHANSWPNLENLGCVTPAWNVTASATRKWPRTVARVYLSFFFSYLRARRCS